MHQRVGAARREEAARLPCLRQGMHPAAPARGHHGLRRRRLRRLLHLWPSLATAEGGARETEGSGGRPLVSKTIAPRADPAATPPANATGGVDINAMLGSCPAPIMDHKEVVLDRKSTRLNS